MPDIFLKNCDDSIPTFANTDPFHYNRKNNNKKTNKNELTDDSEIEHSCSIHKMWRSTKQLLETNFTSKNIDEERLQCRINKYGQYYNDIIIYYYIQTTG